MLTVIAETGSRFASFGPYVASIDRAGRVAFAAAMTGGGHGLFVGDGGDLRAVIEPSDGLVVCSHPALNDAGKICAFVRRGDSAPVLWAGEVTDAIAEPLGPTINASGAIAFRGPDDRGRAAIRVASGGGVETVLVADGDIAGFEGLPVIDDRERVLARAVRADGRGALVVTGGDDTRELLVEGDRVSSIGRFPHLADGGAITFAGIDSGGSPRVFTTALNDFDRALRTLDLGSFAQVRGALTNRAGGGFFYAARAGHELALFQLGTDGSSRRILGIGDDHARARVRAFVLNPVSMTDTARQAAVRLELDDGREQIVRVG